MVLRCAIYLGTISKWDWPGNKCEESNLSITVKYKLNLNQQIWNKLEKACVLNEMITKKSSLKSCINFQEYHSILSHCK